MTATLQKCSRNLLSIYHQSIIYLSSIYLSIYISSIYLSIYLSSIYLTIQLSIYRASYLNLSYLICIFFYFLCRSYGWFIFVYLQFTCDFSHIRWYLKKKKKWKRRRRIIAKVNSKFDPFIFFYKFYTFLIIYWKIWLLKLQILGANLPH